MWTHAPRGPPPETTGRLSKLSAKRSTVFVESWRINWPRRTSSGHCSAQWCRTVCVDPPILRTRVPAPSPSPRSTHIPLPPDRALEPRTHDRIPTSRVERTIAGRAPPGSRAFWKHFRRPFPPLTGTPIPGRVEYIGAGLCTVWRGALATVACTLRPRDGVRDENAVRKCSRDTLLR